MAKHGYTVQMLLKLPSTLRDMLDAYATAHKQSPSFATRLAIARLIGAPEELADMIPRKYPKGYDRTRAQYTRRQQQATIAQALAANPDLLNQLNERTNIANS